MGSVETTVSQKGRKLQQQCEIKEQKELSKWPQGPIASHDVPPLDAGQASFFVLTTTTVEATWTDAEEKKNTTLQLLQPQSCLDRGRLYGPYLLKP